MANTSITTLLQLIDDADQNLEGLVKWEGENNLETIENLIVGELQNRGFLQYDTTSAMAAAGYAQTQLAIVTGIGAYKWYATVTGGSGCIASADGGEWRPLISSVRGQYTQLVHTSSTLVFNLNHNLGKQLCIVQCSTNSVPALFITPLNIVFTDANNLQISFSGGDTNKDINIIVQ